MSLRLVLITEIIAPYRIPVFNALARRAELDVHVIFLSETDSSLRQWRVYSDEIRFSYEVLPSWRWRSGKNNVLVNRGLWLALNSRKPDVIICGGYNYPASWQALLWAQRNRAKFVLWSESNMNDARSGKALVEALKSFFLRKCDGFVVPGKASSEYLHAFGISHQSIVTAPNAVDNNFFEVESAKARTRAAEIRDKLELPSRFILFVGRLVPEKGIFELLSAYSGLEPDVRSEVGLVFAGDGISRAKLVLRAKDIGPGMIRFPGFAQREELAALYALAEVLVLPTHSDPWGLVVNEAMACGLPVIVSNIAGCAADLVENGWNGSAVPPHDEKALSGAIRSLLCQPELRQSMAVHSLERIQNYSPEACAAGLAAAAITSTET